MTWRCPEPKMRCLHQGEEVCGEDCMAGIELVVEGEPEPTALRAVLDDSLAAAGVQIVTCVVERARQLPIV